MEQKMLKQGIAAQAFSILLAIKRQAKTGIQASRACVGARLPVFLAVCLPEMLQRSKAFILYWTYKKVSTSADLFTVISLYI